jgi:hypothetical protein
MASSPFRTTKVDDSILERAVETRMKMPRQSFAEVAWLYQKDNGKATAISKA